MSGYTGLPNNSTSEIRNTGIQIGGPSSSHATPQIANERPVMHVTPIVTAPVEATISAPRGSFVTKDDLNLYIKEIQNKSSMGVLDLKLLYNQQVATKPYPKDYASLKFMLFNGKKGSTKEQLLKFIETLEVYELDDDLKLKECSKPLTEKAYTWYINLPPRSMDS